VYLKAITGKKNLRTEKESRTDHREGKWTGRAFHAFWDFWGTGN